MVRVGAKRERPCMAILHVALRSAAPTTPAGPSPSSSSSVTDSTESPGPERFVWKSSSTARYYASAVLSRVRAWWEMLGGARYGLPDAVQLASAVWEGEESKTAAATAKADKKKKKDAKKAPSQLKEEKRLRRRSATQRRSGVLRCAVQLSRSLYGDAAALHVFRAACACVTEVHVSMPTTAMTATAAAGHGEGDTKDVEPTTKPRRQRIEEGRLEQNCHAAVRVARVEHVVAARKA